MKPYEEVALTENLVIRKFSRNTNSNELVWHRDRENRIVEVISGNGWYFQSDDQLPVLLEKGTRIIVPAGEYHRVIKGQDDLVIKILKEKKKLSKKQMKIAKAAPPEDEITGADFKALQKKKVDEDTKLDDPDYETGRSEAEKKKLAKAVAAYKKAKKTPGKADDMKAIKMRNAVAEGRKVLVDPDILQEYIEELIEEQLLYEALDEVHERESERLGSLLELYEADDDDELDERKKRRKRRKKRRKKRKKRKSASRNLSKAVKKSLDKKADRRCLTRGSVYAEFRAGLGAYYTSGSRKGMSPHQWAHARVNSANPSKKWAKVKKRKKCPKKKKK